MFEDDVPSPKVRYILVPRKIFQKCGARCMKPKPYVKSSSQECIFSTAVLHNYMKASDHMGTPKRCMEPTTTSAPISLGGFARTRLKGSAATMK